MPFEEIRLGVKRYEVRNGVASGHVFRGGDVLRLEEWDPDHGEYTGRVLHAEVQRALNLWDTPEVWHIRANVTVMQIRHIRGADE
jgi:hypothetical protein